MRRFADITETVPRQFSVAGAALRPFCLGHHSLLKYLDLPFQEDEKDDCTFEEMLLCASICSVTYEQGLEMIQSDKWANLIKDWRKRVVGFSLFGRKKFDEEKCVADFKEYITDGYRMPPLWKHPNAGGIVITSPWETAMIDRLAPLGVSVIRNMYLPAAWYQYFTALERAASDKFEGKAQDWRKVFFTHSDAARMEVVNVG